MHIHCLSFSIQSVKFGLFLEGGFELATSTIENRKRLVGSIIELVENGPLDGVDIDWEFPSWGHNLSRRFERDNFSHLLKVGPYLLIVYISHCTWS